VINAINFTSKNNPSLVLAEPTRPTPPAPPAAPAQAPRARRARAARAARRARGAHGAAPPALRVRLGGILVIAAGVLLSWLGAVPRRLGDRWFTMNDTEAYWRGWQITKVQGGLGRRYRDPLFDTLAQCAKCAGSGGGASAPCGPCLRTGRVSIDGVS
jgi:hypothetical protein